MMYLDHSLTKALTLCLAFTSLAACSEIQEEAANTEESWSTAFPGKADIYGEDSRREINDPSVSEQERELAQSVAMVFNIRNTLDITDESISFSRKTMSQEFQRINGVPLCEDEPFTQQVAPGYCTAFLIAPDLMATAGHCVNGHTRCAQMSFAFDYAKSSPSEDPVRISRKDHYRCESIIGRLYDPFEDGEALLSKEYWYDWAVIKLDRPVTDRKPVVLTEGEFIERGAPLTVIGHPSGLPMKLTQGNVVTDDKERYMNTTLDIYKGNSGSPVFDNEGKVHGIVIRGSGGNSFEIVNGECGRSKQCEDIGDPTGCIGNHALRIDPIRIFTNENLKYIEQHSLVDDDEELGFRHSFNFEQEGEVAVATVHLNAGARDSKALKVILHHNGKSVEMMHRPKDLGYGRWTASKFDFKGEPVEGEWIIEVIEEEAARLNVEWAQVMLAYQ